MQMASLTFVTFLPALSLDTRISHWKRKYKQQQHQKENNRSRIALDPIELLVVHVLIGEFFNGLLKVVLYLFK